MLNKAPNLTIFKLAAATLLILWSVSSPDSTSAAGGSAWRTGMFSVARGQTARINAVCLPPGPCQVEMMFLDNMGNVVSRWEHVQELQPGQAAFVDYSFEIPTKQRVELRAVGTTSAGADDKPRRPEVLFSCEVFDNDTGRTAFMATFEEGGKDR